MKKGINIGIAILLVITISAAIKNMFAGPAIGYQAVAHDAFTIIMGVLIVYYNFFGYKKPHGNLMRYICFLFGCSLILRGIFSEELSVSLIANAIAGIIVVYMSGRLDKNVKNKTLVIVVFIFILVSAIMRVFKIDISLGITPVAAASVPADAVAETAKEPPAFSMLLLSLGSLGVLFQWIALSLAYISRYKEHKEAGLLDKAEN